MKICAQNPSNGEYSICGDAWDAPDTEDDVAPFRFAKPQERITCNICMDSIRFIQAHYTRSGKLKF